MDTKSAAIYGAIVMSVIICVIFGAALVFGYLSDDRTILNMLVGAAISNFTIVVGYWVGSSSSSAKKDDVIAESAPPQAKP
jgi:hypothetical protein